MQPTKQQIALIDEIMHLNENMFSNEEKQEFRNFTHALRSVSQLENQETVKNIWAKASDYMIRYADYQRQALTLAKSIRKENS